ncbi:DivIVA domain-containing protein [Streptomyces sp. NRRL F-4489]|uniref:DivIVA domain-containing protein n=1 Tax=Streptomyces sp. NRRL F-4489 TaxID=1609095 RepID=UPI00099EF5BA|nr:DivIVA domain-containing protein [Streptomyces sp. NRRL F-4489]
MFWFMLIAMVVVVAAVTLVVVGGGDAGGAGGGLPDAEPEGLYDPLPQDRPLDRADVEAVRLPVTVRGYRMDDVDDVLDRLGAELAERDARIAELETALAGAHAGAAGGTGPGGAPGGTGWAGAADVPDAAGLSGVPDAAGLSDAAEGADAGRGAGGAVEPPGGHGAPGAGEREEGEGPA